MYLPAAARPDPGWLAEPALLVALGAGTAAYVLRWRSVRPAVGHGSLVWLAAAIVVLAGAWLTPLDGLGDDYLLSAHIVQKLLLIAVAPPLLIRACTPAITAPLHARVTPVLERMPGLAHPVFLLVLGVTVIVGWHAVPIYDLVLESNTLHVVEQLTTLAAGVAVTWPLMSRARGGRQLSGLASVFYLVALEVGIGVMGVWMAWYPRVAYEWYERAPRMLGLDVQTDQAVAGAILLVVEEPLLLVEFGFLFLAMLSREEEEQQRIEAEDAATPR